MKFEAGTKVRFTYEAAHRTCPQFYPPVGTVGVIKRDLSEVRMADVQWPDGSTSRTDSWLIDYRFIEKVEPIPTSGVFHQFEILTEDRKLLAAAEELITQKDLSRDELALILSTLRLVKEGELTC